MKGALFSIGIDLGTTNSALAFTRLDDEYAVSEVFSIPQWTSPTSLGSGTTLPSFLYLPTAGEAGHFGCEKQAAPNWVTGKFARGQAAEFAGAGCEFGQVMALPSRGRSFGAISAMGIGRDRGGGENFANQGVGVGIERAAPCLEPGVCGTGNSGAIRCATGHHYGARVV